MRCFENIAKLIRARRLEHSKGYSQSELSHLLGYKNGQFISNVERALCNVPLKMLKRVSEVLDISPEELKESILLDNAQTLDNFLNMDLSGTNQRIIPNETKNHLDNPMNTTTIADGASIKFS